MAIVALGRAGQADAALAALATLERERPGGARAALRCYNAALDACGRDRSDGALARSVALLRELEARGGVAPDVVSFNTVIAACERRAEWRVALRLLRAMRTERYGGLRPDRISYNAAISACAKGAQPGRALALLREMAAEHDAGGGGPAPDVVSYSAAISACAAAGGGDAGARRALALLDEMRARSAPTSSA